MSASHEVVSWNVFVKSVFNIRYCRPLTRSWVEILTFFLVLAAYHVGLSRGRELKYVDTREKARAISRPLTRSWVEIPELWLCFAASWSASHEVVSWNENGTVKSDEYDRSASHEVVSWNILSCDEYRKYRVGLSRGRELKSFCLAVCFMCYWVGLSRGRELKYKYCTEREKTTESASHEVVSWNMTLFQEASKLCKSASHEAESWNEIYAVEDINAADVSFLEKLWVEITILSLMRSLTSSASMWGRELKYIIDMKILCMEKSASLWGCELK